MPYIRRGRRRLAHWLARNEGAALLENAGDLAYGIAVLMETYRHNHGDSFQTFADIDAANRAAIREFERKVINPYEDAKLVANGPVFARVGVVD